MAERAGRPHRTVRSVWRRVARPDASRAPDATPFGQPAAAATTPIHEVRSNSASHETARARRAIPAAAACRSRSTCAGALQRTGAPTRASRARSTKSVQSIRPLRATTSMSASRSRLRAPSRPPLTQRCSNVSAGSSVATVSERESNRLGAIEQRFHVPGEFASVRPDGHEVPMEVDRCVLVREWYLGHLVIEEAAPVLRELDESGVEKLVEDGPEVLRRTRTSTSLNRRSSGRRTTPRQGPGP